MSDLQQRFGELEDPVLDGETALLEALVPVADRIADFAQREGLYAHGQSVTVRCADKH
jgi:hypothetical protein